MSLLARRKNLAQGGSDDPYGDAAGKWLNYAIPDRDEWVTTAGKGCPCGSPVFEASYSPHSIYPTRLRSDPCMSSEHFGQLAWQFKRMSGSSGLKVQAAI